MIGVESLEGEENPVEQLLSTTPSPAEQVDSYFIENDFKRRRIRGTTPSPAEQVDSYLPLPMLKDYRQ